MKVYQIFLITVLFCCQKIQSQTINNPSDSLCKLSFIKAYYIQIKAETKSGLINMNGVSYKMIDIDKNNKKTYRTFISDLYNQIYYTPYLSQLGGYYSALNYCKDPLTINIINNLSQFKLKETFWLEELLSKNIVLRKKLDDGTKVIIKISKVEGMFYEIEKDYEVIDFTVSDELDIYEMNNIKEIFIPQDIVIKSIE